MEDPKKYLWVRRWFSRNEKIAQFIKPNINIIDIGGGFGDIRKYKNFKKYVSIDIAKWTEDTIVCDLNKDKLPDIDIKFDLILCQGIFEYIKEPDILLRKIQKYSRNAIITYRKGIRDKKYPRINNYALKDFRKIIKDNGWKIKVKFKSVGSLEEIYLCEKIG